MTGVNAAMRELNYQPNTLAWSLQGKQTKMIGVIMPSITNPFFAELVAAIEDKLEADGYKMLLCDAGQDSDKERRYLRMLEANQVDGIIAGSHNLGIEEYQRYGLPIVSFDRYLSDQVPIVTSDNYQAAAWLPKPWLTRDAGMSTLSAIRLKQATRPPAALTATQTRWPRRD